MPGRSYNIAFSGNQYKFGSKELDDENNLNFYHFEARRYDPQIARFTTIDPLTRLSPDMTPYHYVRNNPMNRINPTGTIDFGIRRIFFKHITKMFTKEIVATGMRVVKYDEWRYMEAGDC